ncbi:agamous-like MADS-box protein AGL61 [Zingiber officinale]|uniref:agamous-like MADS-box protein AGL61 n=1 Tax=Zingiber officinale TaxID=94328 RepID=UPI001C4C8BD3|nr:agamous-like MADS-box protein AGL61 [Zingiber officinale]
MTTIQYDHASPAIEKKKVTGGNTTTESEDRDESYPEGGGAAGEAARQVCFSKRRAGVFKKASELSVLCGAEIAVLASGKPFSYGHPSVESILERFFGGSADAAPATPPRHPLSGVLVQTLGRQEKELRERLEEGRRRKAALEEALRGPQWGPVGDLLGADVEELGPPELDLLQSALEWVRAEAVSRARQLAVEALPAPTGEASGEGFAFSSAPPGGF